MIYVTVGTMFMDFPRLIRAMDAIALDTGEHVIVQYGMGTTIPEHCESFAFRPREEVLRIQREARLVVSHAGIGCVLDAIELQRPLLAVPRLKSLGEHMDGHQVQIAEAVQRRGWGRMIMDTNELAAACASPPEPPREYRNSAHRLVWAVRDVADRIAAKKAAR